MEFTHAAVLALCFWGMGTASGAAQVMVGGSGAPHIPVPSNPEINGPGDDQDTARMIDEEKRLRALNADRQKSLVSDTNKLLVLVNELNAEIARSKADALTAEQLRKVAEIEKLARNVREKMSLSVKGPPSNDRDLFRTP
jgi:hypothetical protein